MTSLPASWPPWRASRSGAAAVAERDALGTTVRIAVWPAHALRAAVGAVDRELDRLDRVASRFRADSEICQLQARRGAAAIISPDLAEALAVALAAARWSGGLLDPTIGPTLIALGYDRDFVEVQGGDEHEAPRSAASPADWQSVQLTGLRAQLPADVVLDLGATAKGLGADWAVSAALTASSAGGVVVSLGGDIAVGGQSPRGGWPVLIAEDHRQRASASGTQVVRLDRGGLATSSITGRQWRRAGQALHHIIDPRTGQPAAGPWRMVSVAAATCADANAASTTAIICGEPAPSWLADRGIPARLVGRDGRVVLTGDWPAVDGGQLLCPAQRWLRLPAEAGRKEQG